MTKIEPINTDNLIIRCLRINPEATIERICAMAPELRNMDKARLEQKIEYFRGKIKKGKWF